MEGRATFAAAEATSARFRDAGERSDLPAFLETLAEDVRLRSPISFRARFEGFDEVADVLAVVFETLTDIDYSEDLGDARTRALFYRARVRDQPVEGAILVRLDDAARVAEMTMFFRPLPGLTTLTAHLTPRLAARRGRMRGFLLAAMTRPVAVLTRWADVPGVWLLQGRRR